MNRSGVVALTALACSIVALMLATWAVVIATQTRDEIRHLGEILSRDATPHGMRLDTVRPPELDTDVR